jgi:hypothetical protein
MTDLLASPPNLNHTYFRIYENYDEALREEKEWKRHDINSHDARQYWICQQTTISQVDSQSMICHNVSNNCMLHETYLCRCHEISSKELIKECVGKLGQQPPTQYYCGFCTSSVKKCLGKGKDAWHERFNPFGDHMEYGDQLLLSGHDSHEFREGYESAQKGQVRKHLPGTRTRYRTKPLWKKRRWWERRRGRRFLSFV